MPTTSTKGKPVLAGTDAFAPYTHINNAVNWAETFASVRNVADSTAMNALSGNDVWVGLTVYHTGGTYAGSYWVCSATSGSPASGTWKMLNIGVTPSALAGQTGNILAADASYALLTYNSTTLKGGITQSAGVFTVPIAGSYQVVVQLNWGTGAGTSFRELDIDRSQNNGSTWSTITVQRSYLTSSATYYQNASALLDCNAGDQIRIRGYQNAGASINMSGTTVPQRVSIQFMGS